ncbi:MAG: GNAT family N-acetyltransferase [Patescibacteria group bacterium]|nr:GNAT family N-acetyltransferase [Patescibacteria group bacterium]
MRIVTEEFDSSIFKKKVLRVILNSSLYASEIEFLREELSKIRNAIVYCTIPVTSTHIRVLEDCGFSLISIRNTYVYRRDLNKTFEDKLPGYKVIEFRSDMNISDNVIHRFATVIGEVNRYFKDPKINKQHSQELYIQWIKNSLYHGLATKCFFVCWGQDQVGICTTRLNGSDARIDLFGVLPEFQERGVGKLLLGQALQYLLSHDPNIIWVATAGENIRANIFFQRNGFVIEKVELVYHKHN